MDRKDVVYIHKHTHTRILLIHKEEWNLAIFDNMEDLEGITINEINHTYKENYCVILLIGRI